MLRRHSPENPRISPSPTPAARASSENLRDPGFGKRLRTGMNLAGLFRGRRADETKVYKAGLEPKDLDQLYAGHDKQR